MTEDDDRSQEWFPVPCDGSITGVALVIHGLNLDPLRMSAIIEALNRAGVESVLLSLRGHGANFSPESSLADDDARLESLRQVTDERWQAETLRAYDAVRQRSESANCPIFLVAFSMGCLMGCDMMLAEARVTFDRMLFFAPALRRRLYTNFPRLFSRFPRFLIRSVAPRDYRSNRATPVAAYNALFATARRFNRNLATGRLNVPTIVFVDCRDELVSCRALLRMIDQFGLTQWHVEHVVKDEVAQKIYHHLVIDADCVGASTWQKMMELATNHLLS